MRIANNRDGEICLTTQGKATLIGYLETAERELRRVPIISNQTLQFHRQATISTPVFLSELIESAVLIYQGRIVNTQVMVEQRLRAHDPIACFDGEIRQVLSHLVG